MATTPLPSTATFVLLVPTGNLAEGPAGNPWRPVLYTVDLEAIASSAAWGGITGALASQADLAAALALKAALASPTFTGTPAAPTAAPGTSTTQLASTAFVAAAVAPLAPLASPALTGNPTAPTASPGDADTTIATTAFAAALAALRVAGYTVGGATTGMRLWAGVATTDASGDFTLDYSAAGYATSPLVICEAILSTATITDMVWTTIRTRTSTTAAGTAIRGAVLAALGNTVRRAPTGITVMGVAVGT